MFAKVLAKLEEHSIMLNEVRENGKLIESEIASLKSWRDNFQGKMAMITVLISLLGTLFISIIVSYFK